MWTVIFRADGKSQVSQCLDFTTANFWFLLAYEQSEDLQSQGVDVFLVTQNIPWAQHLFKGLPNLFPSPPLLSWHAQCRQKRVVKTTYKVLQKCCTSKTSTPLEWRSSLFLWISWTKTPTLPNLRLPISSCKKLGSCKLQSKCQAVLSLELIGSLKFVNVWVLAQLIFGPRWPMNQLNKTPTLPNLRLPISYG